MANQKDNRQNRERERFIDSSFDQGDSLINRSNDVDRYLGLDNINPSLGPMVGPGAGGFRLADTPQAWVFIQKKEWTDDTWTYVVNDPEVTISSNGVPKKINVSSLTTDLEVAKAELNKLKLRSSIALSPDVKAQLDQQIKSKQLLIQQLESDLKAAQQVMAEGGTTSQVNGKLTQIDIRSALANIITRKIDWVSDHEKFTKATTSYDQSVEAIQFNRQRQFIQNSFQGTQSQSQSIDKTITELDNVLRSLQESNASLKKQQKQLIEKAGNSLAQLELLKAQLKRLQEKRDSLITQYPDPAIVYPDGNSAHFQAMETNKKRIAEITEEVESLKVSSSVLGLDSFPEGIGSTSDQIFLLWQEQSRLKAANKAAQEDIGKVNDYIGGYQTVQAQITSLNEAIIIVEADIIKLEIEIKRVSETSSYHLDEITNQIQTNNVRINEITAQRTKLGAQLPNADNDPTFNYETAKLYAPTTFSGNAYTRYYKSPVFKTKDSKEALELEAQLQLTLEQLNKETAALIEQTRTGRAGTQELLLQKQLEYIETRQQLDRLSTKISARQLDAPIAIEVGQSSFNGVIELANISQINTSINIEGEGNASFTIENPQNIFFISQEDIDLALTEDPFLEETRTLEGMVYYRGRFYPPHVVDMLIRRKGYTAGSFNTKEALSASLSSQIEDLNKQIRIVDTQRATASMYKNMADLERLENKSASLQANLVELQRQQQSLNKSLSSRTAQQMSRDQAAVDPKTKAKEDRMDLIRQVLSKYYVSKAIFQVLDRVYIWMTSPTRTINTLNRQGDRFGLEDSSVVVMGRQLPDAEAHLSTLQTEKAKVEEYLRSLGMTDLSDYSFVPDFIPAEFVPNPTAQRLVDKNGTGSASLPFEQTKVYYLQVSEQVSLAQETVEIIRKQIVSTDTLTGARTFGKLPFSQNLAQSSQDQKQIVCDYDSRYLGIEEERLQVFQGVISTVKQTFSDGKYQIQVSCRDNLVFLSMSRIMIKPALRADQGPQGTLQDPIWRGNSLSGNWKNGIVVLDYAFVNDEVRARMDKNFDINTDVQKNLVDRKVLGESEARESVVPYVTSLPFAKIDAANLISFIITGFPYTFESFIKNAAFGGRIVPQRTSGTTDQRGEKTSYFAFLKRRIGELNDRLGDFEPFIDLGGNQFDPEVLKKKQDDLTANLDDTINTLVEDYTQYVVYRMSRFFTRVQSASDSALLTGGIMAGDVLGKTLPSISMDTLKQQATFTSEILKQGTSAFVDAQGRPIFIIQKLINVVVNAAQKNRVRSEASLNVAKTGASLGTDAEVDDIVNTILKPNLSDLGPFQVVRTLVFSQAAAALKTSEQGKVTTGPGQAASPSTPSQQQEVIDVLSAAYNATLPFVKALLTVQTDFAEAFQQASIAATNNAELEAILPDLKQYVADIKSQSLSVQADIKDGPQATIEKIVRGEKKNFLIISDQYQLDMDLQAYQNAVGTDFALFQSEWETPLSICRRAAEQVDFEFYADENGNLQFKPPTYNRILREHFPLISETDRGVRDAILIRYGGSSGGIFQAVLKALSLLNQLRIEYSSKRFQSTSELSKKQAQKKKVPTQSDVDGNSANPSQQETQNVSNEEITEQYKTLRERYLQHIMDGAVVGDATSWQPITPLSDAEQQARLIVKKMHLAEDRQITQVELTFEQMKYELSKLEVDKGESESALKELEQELEEARKAEQPKRSIEAIAKDIEGVKSGTAYLQSQINTKSSEIEELRLEAKVQIFTQLFERADFLVSQANKTREKVRQKTEAVVDSLKHFVDEYRIHRIADYDLISYDLTEAPPRFTYLEITGAPDLVPTGPSEYYWAGGVDYDNWRQYGYLSESMQKAYFHSGNSARTYVRAMLGRERGRIFSASVSVRGDSKFRVGDCVFIECLGMYFYILTISNSLSYGGTYTSSLTLAYGRRIGELIPHPFDVLGKIMIDTYQSALEELLAQQQYAGIKQEQVNKNT